MLNERRVLHITRMEIRRQKEQEQVAPFMNVDKRDYLSFKHLTGFIAGSLFYGLVLIAVLILLFTVILKEVNRAAIILIIILAIIGYVAFMYIYQSWNHRHTLNKINIAKKKIKRLKRDWDELESMYEQEEKETAPAVDMDVLFPEGSLGENE